MGYSKYYASINLDKIDVNKLWSGKQGKYLNIVIHISEELDRFGNNGFIAENATKEEKESGKFGTIIGNLKTLNKSEKPIKSKDKDDLPMEDLPF